MGFEEGQIDDDLHQFYVKLTNNLKIDELSDPDLLDQFSAFFLLNYWQKRRLGMGFDKCFYPLIEVDLV